MQYYKSLSVIFQLQKFKVNFLVLVLLISNLLIFVKWTPLEISLSAFMGHPWFTQRHYSTVSKFNCCSLSKAKIKYYLWYIVVSQFIKLFFLCLTCCTFYSYLWLVRHCFYRINLSIYLAKRTLCFSPNNDYSAELPCLQVVLKYDEF